MAKALLKTSYPEPENQEDKKNEIDLLLQEHNVNPEFTTARQVLAMHFLFDYCNISNVDLTAKARFIQFLNGKETNAQTITNTNIYKKLKKPYPADEKTLIKDLKYIRTFFEDLGLTQIVDKINKEIGAK
jgi:hypothetical protein